MTPEQAMKIELRKIQKAQDKCIENGYITNRNVYNRLVIEARDYRESIVYMEEMRSER